MSAVVLTREEYRCLAQVDICEDAFGHPGDVVSELEGRRLIFKAGAGHVLSAEGSDVLRAAEEE